MPFLVSSVKMKDDEQNGQLLLFAEETEPETTPAYTAETLPYFPEPCTDGERLMNAQYDYLLFSSAKAWRELWTLTLTVAGRIIEAERKKKDFTYRQTNGRTNKWKRRSIYCAATAHGTATTFAAILYRR